MPEDQDNPDRTGAESNPDPHDSTDKVQPVQPPSEEAARPAQQSGDQDAQPSGSEEKTRPGLSVPAGAGGAQESDADRSGKDRDAGPGKDEESDPERTQTIPVVYANSAGGGPTGADESDAERTQTIPALTESINVETRQTPHASTGTTQVGGSPGTQAFGSATQPVSGQYGSHDQQGQYGWQGQYSQGQYSGDVFGGGYSASAAPEDTGSRKNRRTLIRAGIAAGVAAGVLLLLYIGDLAFSAGQVPRGTVVAGVDVGGLDRAAAEKKLRTTLGPGLDEPVQLRVGKATASIDPQQAGLSIDWEATLDKAGSQPLNPVTRIASFFTTREIAPVSNVQDDKLVAALKEVKPQLHREPVEGTIRFEGADPVAVMPVTGRTVDVAQAKGVVVRQWAGRSPVALPYTTEKVSTTPEGVREALKQVAEPAVSEPVTIVGDGLNATLTPTEIASAMRFEPNGKGGLKWHIDIPAATEAVKPELAASIKPGKDASFVFQGGKPVVQPSVDGRGIDWKKTFAPLRKVLVESGGSSMRAVYEDQPAKFTTEEAKALGIREKVSSFTTKGFSPDSGVNIRRVAQEVNGALVKPGETFSLNGYTGVRQKPQGYIASGIIKNGRPAKAVGGGISQFATTLFNASYFAGMKDIEHREHSYYISRYPLGREATVFQRPDGTSVIDVKFKNVSDSGILIQTRWTPESITVTMWGTRQYKVETKVSPKSEPTKPETITVPPGKKCIPTSGQPGFTVYNTRIRTDIKTGEVTKTRDKTVYEPQPVVKCAPPPPPPPPR